jgi:hypothetical protein
LQSRCGGDLRCRPRRPAWPGSDRSSAVPQRTRAPDGRWDWAVGATGLGRWRLPSTVTARRDTSPCTSAGSDIPGYWFGKGFGKGFGKVGRAQSRAVVSPTAGLRPERSVVRRCRLTALAVSALLAVAAAGCGSGSTASTARPGTGTTADPQAATKTAVVAAWLSGQQSLAAAERDPRGAYSPVLTNYFVDPALQEIRRTLVADEHAGDIVRGSVTFGNPRVVTLLGNQAIVSSCLDGTGILVHADTGQPTAGPSGHPGPTGIRSTMLEASPGVWKTSNSTTRDGSCAGF